MKRPSLILFLTTFLTLLVPPTALAMPAGDGSAPAADGESAQDDFFQQVIEKRRTAGESYQAMREERLKTINRTAVRPGGHADRVPGWKLDRKQVSAPAEEPTDTKGLYILLVVGAGVILSLFLRVFAPFLFDRKPRRVQAGEPMTIKLKPREERKFGRA